MLRIKDETLVSILESIDITDNPTLECDESCVRLAINAHIPMPQAVIIIDMLKDTIKYVLDAEIWA